MKKIFIFIFFLLCASNVFAQTERQLTVSEIRQQTVLNEPLTLQKGYFYINPQFNYLIFSTDYYNNDWKKVPSYAYQSNIFLIPFSITYGLSNNLQISVQSNYEYSFSSYSYKDLDYYKPERTKYVEYNKLGKGFNDLSLTAEYKLVDQKSKLPAMAMGMSITIPYGKKEPSLSDDGEIIYTSTSGGYYALSFIYGVKKVFYPFSVSAFAMYDHHFPTDLKLHYNDSAKLHIKYGDHFEIMANINYLPSDWIALQSTFLFSRNASTDYGDDPIYKYSGNPTVYFKWEPKLTFQIRNIRLSQGISFYLKAKNSNADPMAFISLGIKI